MQLNMRKAFFAVFYLLMSACLFVLFRHFGLFVFWQQEELQFFIPEFSFYADTLARPGGFSQVLGQFIVQGYHSALFSLLINSLLITAVSLLTFLLLNSNKRYALNAILSVAPALVMTSFAFWVNNSVSGVVAMILVLLSLCIYQRITTPKGNLIFGICSAIVLYFTTGPLVLIYGLLALEIKLLSAKKDYRSVFVTLLLSIVLTLIGTFRAEFLPITEGLRSKAMLMSLPISDTIVYRSWLQCALALAIVIGVSKAADWLPLRKILKISIVTLATALVIVPCVMLTYKSLPSKDMLRMNQLAYLSSKGKWASIVNISHKSLAANNLQRCYYNYARAREGVLGNDVTSLSMMDVQCLIPPADGSYLRCMLLSDIHFLIGDISRSEGFAMDAKRINCPKAMQRLTQIYLIKSEWRLAEKNINLLSRMPHYKDWAEQHRQYLKHPELIETDAELSGKKEQYEADNLLCNTSEEATWLAHLNTAKPNRTAFQYLACYYLISNNIDGLRQIVSAYGDNSNIKPVSKYIRDIVAINEPTQTDNR